MNANVPGETELPADALQPSGLAESTAILAVDHGAQRIGLAVWDPTSGVRPAGVVRHRSRVENARRIARIAAERKAGQVVVGLPLNADGSEGPQAARVRSFVADLAQVTALPIALFDERETTQEAIAALGLAGRQLTERERQLVDQQAAVILLERYLRCQGG